MHALRLLEYEQIRQMLANECETAIGGRLASEQHPSFEDEAVWEQLELTDQARLLLEQERLPSLAPVKDNRKAVVGASKGSVLGGEVLYEVAESLGAMRSLLASIRQRQSSAPKLYDIALALPELVKLETTLFASLDGSGELRDSASEQLGKLRRSKIVAAQRITERIHSYVSGRSRELLSDPIYTQRDGRYVIPLKAENRGKIRGIVHDTSASGQTLFVEPEDVLALGNSLRELEAAERAEVARILAQLSSMVGTVGHEIAKGIECAGALDLTFAKARLGLKINGVIPIRMDQPSIAITKGRHPLLNPSIAVPLDLQIGDEVDGLLITGPNTGGKTVAIKTVGLFVLMAQSGMMLPAQQVRLGTFSQVWADIGDEQSLQQSLSTFSGHIKNISKALRELHAGALVLLDELGAGTDPAEGAALAKAVLLEFQKGGAKILASSHYGELKIFAYNTPGFANGAMEFDLKTLSPTYRLMMGAPGASHALRIAERCGMPKSVVEVAKLDAGVQQQEVARMLERLEAAQKQAHKAQSEADRMAARIRQVEHETTKKLAQAEEARKRARSDAAEALENALREIRLEAAKAFEELKNDRSVESKERARERLKSLQHFGQEVVDELAPRVEQAQLVTLQEGMRVRVHGHSQTGLVVSRPHSGKVLIQIGMIKMSVKVADLTVVQDEPERPNVRPRSQSTLGKAMHASSEINLRMMRAEDADEALDKFLDDAILGGLTSVRIVHGKGEGVIRSVTRRKLKAHKGVVSFRDGEPSEGGHGVTVAILK